MGCCLTKKSRNRNNNNSKGLNESLLNGERPSNELPPKLNPARGGRSDGYVPVQLPSDDDQYSREAPPTGDINLTNKSSKQSKKTAPTNRAEPKKVEVIAAAATKTTVEDERRVIGESLLVLPTVKSLKISGVLEKRGHMVRNWKSRFIVINDGEILYFDKSNETKTAGVGKPKGKLHLLGAICELKENEAKLPTIEIIGRAGEKDLLLQFKTLEEAYKWFDIINWTIFRWNLNSIEAGDGPEETNRWYLQQAKKFETNFEDLEKGYTFSKHGFDSITGDLQLTNCIVKGVREDLCLQWFNIVDDDGVKKKSQPFTIYLNDITDVIIGSYQGYDMPMVSIVSAAHILDLQIIDSSAEVFMQALRKCIVFLSIPVPSALQSRDTESSGILKANKKARAVSTHGKL